MMTAQYFASAPLWVATMVLLSMLPVARPYPSIEAWKSRTIFQVLTDRFATEEGDVGHSSCGNFNRYCGGTWRGTQQLLPYIKDLGFDAVWISPMTEQTTGPTWQYLDGYHGYWPKSYAFDSINSHFGSADDLVELVSAAHAMGIWVILDIVPNHMGFAKTSEYVPFDDDQYFHSCDICGAQCVADPDTYYNKVICRLTMLPDLNQSVPFVAEHMISWAQQQYEKYDLDGLRVDAAMYLQPEWLQDFTNSTSIFTTGEWFDQDLNYIVERMNTKQLQSALNFPFYYAILSSFVSRATPWSHFQESTFYYEPPANIHTLYAETINLLDDPGQALLMPNFVENHDVPRFLCWNPDVAAYKNALAVMAYYPGIPTLYSGAEQGFQGQRDAAWNWGYDRDSEMYVFISRLMKYRNVYNVSSAPYEPVLYSLLHSVASPLAVATLAPSEAHEQEQLLYNPDNYGLVGGMTTYRLAKGQTAESVTGFTRSDVVVLFNNFRDGEFKFSEQAATAAADPNASTWQNYLTTPIILLPERLGRPPASSWAGEGLSSRFYTYNDTATYRRVMLTNVFDPTDTLLVLNGVVQYTLTKDRSPKVYIVTSRSFDELLYPVPQGVVVQPLPPYVPHSYYHPTGVGTLITAIVFYCVAGALALLLGLAMHRSGPRALKRLLERTPDNLAKKTDPEEGNALVQQTALPHELELTNAHTPLDVASAAAVCVTPAPARLRISGTGDGLRQRAGARLHTNDGSPWMASPEPTPKGRRTVSALYPRGEWNSQWSQHGMFQAGAAAELAGGSGTRPWNDMPRLPSSSQIIRDCSNQAAEDDFMSRKTRSAHFMRHSLTAIDPCSSMLLPIETMVDVRISLRNSSSSAGAAGGFAPVAEAEGEVTAAGLSTGGMLDLVPRDVRPTSAAGSSMVKTLRHLIQRTAKKAKMPLGAEADADGLRAFARVPDEAVMHVAMEYTIPHLGMNSQFSFGGLGKVVGMFLSHSPPEDQVLLCAPLYADAYADADSHKPTFFDGSSPDFSFSVTVNSALVNVDLFLLSGGANITYIFLQAEVFRHRKQGTIYKFGSELEMLNWLAVMNQSVAVVISLFQICRVQFHDYHGALSLLYLPPAIRPMVLYVAHNAHYNGTFPMVTTERKEFIFRVLDFPRHLEGLVSSKGYFDILNALVSYLIDYQDGYGVVAVSPRYASQIHKKFDIFKQLSASRVKGIMNALPLSESLAELVQRASPELRPALLQQVRDVKRRAKGQFQAKYGLVQDPNFQLVCFLGRMTHQKGCDIIALAATYMLQHCPNSQLVMVGPIGDDVGRQAQSVLDSIKEKFPGRIYAPGGVYFDKEDKALLLQAADFCLMPSRFEPCGLVDIEFGWNGSLIIGHNTGGLGKMPGVFFTVQSSSQAHLTAKMEAAMAEALSLAPEVKQRMVEAALTTAFPVDVMIDGYHEVWSKIGEHASINSAPEFSKKSSKHDTFHEDLWRERNIKDRSAEDDKIEKLLVLPSRFGFRLTRQMLSDLLMPVLQIYAQLPGCLVMGFVLFLEIGESEVLGCIPTWDSGLSPEGISDWLPKYWGSFLVRVTTYFLTTTFVTPIWGVIVMLIRPSSYLRWSVFWNCAAMGMVLACVYWNTILFPAIIVAGICSATGPMLTAVAFLGYELEVSEVGLRLMTFSICGLSLFVFVSFVLAATALSNLVFAVMAGLGMIGSALGLIWFAFESSLSPAYFHMQLDFGRQWKILGINKTFWITLTMIVTDTVALCLVSYLALLMLPSLRSYSVLMAIEHGTKLVFALLTCWLLQTKFFQLRIQTWTLLLASVIGIFFAQAAAVAWGSTNIAYVIMFVSTAMSALRTSLVGLTALQALPTRELMALWMVLATMLGTGIVMIVLLVALLNQNYLPTTNSLLIGVGVVEAVRAGLSVILNICQPAENLATL